MQDKRQVALFEIQPEALRAMLGLPDGVIITGVREPIDKLGVLQVRVEGMGWWHREGNLLPATWPIVKMRPAGQGEQVPEVDWRCPMPGEGGE